MTASPTNTLAHKGYEVKDGQLLGYIAWYSIADPKIAHADLLALVTINGLDLSVVPNPPRSVDAFKRACRQGERKNLPVPLTDNTVNILIRQVTTTPEETERHIVVETVDPDGRRLNYFVAAALTFERASGNVTVKRKISKDSEVSVMVDDTIEAFRELLKEALKTIEAQVIRLMIRQQLKLLHAVNVRPNGSVYFIPGKYKDKVVGLENLCTQLNSGSVFHSVPLINTSKQREMVLAAFEEDVHNKAVQNISELKEFLDNGKQVTPKAWIKYKNELKSLTQARNEYKDLVDMEMSKADIEVKALREQLETMLVSDMVKT